jgi:hypothetical protein
MSRYHPPEESYEQKAARVEAAARVLAAYRARLNVILAELMEYHKTRTDNDRKRLPRG